MSGQNCQIERRDKVLELYRSGERTESVQQKLVNVDLHCNRG